MAFIRIWIKSIFILLHRRHLIPSKYSWSESPQRTSAQNCARAWMFLQQKIFQPEQDLWCIARVALSQCTWIQCDWRPTKQGYNRKPMTSRLWPVFLETMKNIENCFLSDVEWVRLFNRRTETNNKQWSFCENVLTSLELVLLLKRKRKYRH